MSDTSPDPEQLDPSPLSQAEQTLPAELYDAIFTLLEVMSTDNLLEEIQRNPVLLTREFAAAIDNMLETARQTNHTYIITNLQPRYENLKQIVELTEESLGVLPYDLTNVLREWMNVDVENPDESQEVLKANPDLLLSKKSLEILEFLLSFPREEEDEGNGEGESTPAILRRHLSLLIKAQAKSIEVAYANHRLRALFEKTLQTTPQILRELLRALILAAGRQAMLEQIKQYPVLLTPETTVEIDKFVNVLRQAGQDGKRLWEIVEPQFALFNKTKAELETNREVLEAFLEADAPTQLQQVIVQHPMLLEEKTEHALAATITEIEQMGDTVLAQRLRLRLQELQRIRQQREQSNQNARPARNGSDADERIAIYAERGGIAANEIHGNIYQIENYSPPAKQWKSRPRQSLRKAFIGRHRELDDLLAYLMMSDDSATASTATVAIIQGMGGIGKSYLARKVTIELFDHFAGRIIWIDAGVDVRSEAKSQFLLGQMAKYAFGLEVPIGQLSPDDVAVWLEEMAPGRILAVFDDVWEPETLRLLDAALPANAVRLITTRDAIVARTLEGKILFIDRLTPQDGLDLLEFRLRCEGNMAYRGDLEELVSILDGHAQSLDIVAARIKKPVHARAVLNDLKNGIGSGKLDGLKLASGEQKDDNVEKSLALTYERMDEEQQHHFRTSGIFAQGTPITPEAAAAIWGMEELNTAQIALFNLADLALLTEIEEPTGIIYRQHGLLHVYARALMEEAGERVSTSWAHAKYYTDMARRVEGADPIDYSLLDRHIQNVLTALTWTGDNEPALFSELLHASDQFLHMRGQSALLEAYLPKAVDIAAMMENNVLQADFLLRLGLVKSFQGNPDQTRYYFEMAKTLFHSENYQLGEANALKSLGDLESHEGNLDQARTHYDLALQLLRNVGDKGSHGLSQAGLLISLGHLETQLGNLDQARTHIDAALSISREKHDLVGEAIGLTHLGTLETRLGNIDQARIHFDAALPLVRGKYPYLNEAVLLESLGNLELQLGNFDQARTHYDAALTLTQTEKRPFIEAVLYEDMGELERFLGNFDQARAHYDAALPLMRTERTPLGEANVLKRLGDLDYRLGKLDEARSHYNAALLLYQQVHNQLGEANVLKKLGDLNYRLGKIDEARTHYNVALLLFQQLQDRLGEANVQRSLGDLERRLNRREEARAYYDTALSLYRLEQARLGEANTLTALGDLQQQLSKFDEALAYYNAALPLFQKLYNHLGEANLHQSLGNLERKRDKFDEARAHYDAALSLYQQTHHALGRAYIYTSIGELLVAQKQFDQAQCYYEQALPLFIAEQDPTGQARTLLDLGIVRFERGDREQGMQDVQDAIPLFRLVYDEQWMHSAEIVLTEMQAQLASSDVGEEEQVHTNSLRIIQVQDGDLERGDISNLKRVLEQVISVPEHARALRGNIAITFPKYDSDPRENFQIDEVRQFVQHLDAEFPYFPYFLIPNSQIFFWLACLLPSSEMLQHENKVGISVDPRDLALLLGKRIVAIDMFCEKISDDSSPTIKGIFVSLPEELATYVVVLFSEDETDDE